MPTPGVIEYPGALDTALTLIEVLNNASSTLTANISVGDLLIPVADPGKFPNSGFATLVDSLTAPTKIEVFVYTSKSGSNLVVPSGGRGAQGTTAQAFNTGHFVEQRPTARHHTVFADLLLAIEAKLGIGGDTPGAAVEALFSNGAGASVWRAIAQADIAGAIGNLVRKDDATLQAIISNLRLSKAAPALELTDTIPEPDQTAVLDVTGGNLRLTPNLLLALATGIVSFGQIPILPGTDPTTDNQAARAAYVNSRRTRWAASFYIPDPAARGIDVDFSNIQGAHIPGSNFVATHVGMKGTAGSNTGAFIVILRKQPAGSFTQTDLGGINWNPGLGSVLGVNQEVDVTGGPHALTAGDFVYPVISAISAPAQKSFWVYIRGYQTPQNP